MRPALRLLLLASLLPLTGAACRAFPLAETTAPLATPTEAAATAGATPTTTTPREPTDPPPTATWPPQPSPTSPEPGLDDLPRIPGLSDGLLLALGDGSLVVRTPDTGDVTELLPRGMYQVRDDGRLIPILWPVRMAPQGESRAIVPTPADGTWLVGLDGTRQQLSERRLLATWAPDGRRLVYADSSPTTGMPDSGKVYVRDLAEHEPALVATVPGLAWNALWAPGCAGCPEAVAVASQGDGTLILTLVDPTTGETRQLGEFTPPAIGGNLFHAWSADGRFIIAQTGDGSLAFPVAGGSPLAYVNVSAGNAMAGGLPSPDGTHVARIIRDEDGTARVQIAAATTGETAEAPRTFPQVERSLWSSDGRYLLLESYDCTVEPCGYRVWALDAATAEPHLAAEAVAFIGSVPTLQGRATESAGPVGEITPTTDPLGQGEWTQFTLGETGIAPAAPAAWAVDVSGDRITVINFDVVTPGGVVTHGGVALGPDDVWIAAEWVDWAGNAPDYADAEMVAQLYYDAETAVVDVGNRQGSRIRGRLHSLCDRYLVNHGSGALDMTVCAPETLAADFLSRLDFGAGQ